MKPKLTHVVAFTAFAGLAALSAGVALADDDCRVPMADWQPREAVIALADENGWMLHEIEIDDGCYEIEARNREGRDIEVTLDPRTLAVIEIEYDDDDDKSRGNRRGPTPAGTIAPPANGLFENATPPQVKSN